MFSAQAKMTEILKENTQNEEDSDTTKGSDSNSIMITSVLYPEPRGRIFPV